MHGIDPLTRSCSAGVIKIAIPNKIISYFFHVEAFHSTRCGCITTGFHPLEVESHYACALGLVRLIFGSHSNEENRRL